MPFVKTVDDVNVDFSCQPFLFQHTQKSALYHVCGADATLAESVCLLSCYGQISAHCVCFNRSGCKQAMI